MVCLQTTSIADWYHHITVGPSFSLTSKFTIANMHHYPPSPPPHIKQLHQFSSHHHRKIVIFAQSKPAAKTMDTVNAQMVDCHCCYKCRCNVCQAIDTADSKHSNNKSQIKLKQRRSRQWVVVVVMVVIIFGASISMQRSGIIGGDKAKHTRLVSERRRDQRLKKMRRKRR